jgi:hypothetical protein
MKPLPTRDDARRREPVHPASARRFGSNGSLIGRNPHFAILRRIALDLLKGDSKTKLGIANKHLKASWDVSYLGMLLGI